MSIERLRDVVFPARDQSLARVVSGLSEPETGRPADNLITNEDSFGRVVGDLERLAPPGGVYLGVGPDQNLSYIARARTRLAFIVDFRRRNALVHLVHKGLFLLSTDRVSYLNRLTARHPGPLPGDPNADDLVRAFSSNQMSRPLLDRAIVEVADVLGPLGLVRPDEWSEVARIQSRLAGPGLEARFLALPMYPTFGRLIQSKDRANQPAHFLAGEAGYQAVRAIQAGDRLIPMVGNFAGSRSIAALAEWLRSRGLGLSVFYISDVEFFLLRSGQWPGYVENLSRLPWLEGAVLIRSSTREIAHPDRHPPDSSTTILRPVGPFLEAARAGKIGSLDDLFAL